MIMAKMHTRMKRRLGISTHKRGNIPSLHKKKGPKTFATEERANEYAKEQGITKFELKSVKKDKRFQIVNLE
jgi:hypothetical protein